MKRENSRWKDIILTGTIYLALWLVVVCNATAAEKTKLTVEKGGTYSIGSGDILEITTWKEPDFSREEIMVRIDGYISFPLLNDVLAAGQTPMGLKKVLEKKLQSFVASPVVTVNVRAPDSQKFYILGEVVNTGEYNLSKRLRVLQAFALAGGFTEWASKDEIIVLRQERGKERIFRVDYKDLIRGEDLRQNIFLKANDTIIVP